MKVARTQTATRDAESSVEEDNESTGVCTFSAFRACSAIACAVRLSCGIGRQQDSFWTRRTRRSDRVAHRIGGRERERVCSQSALHPATACSGCSGWTTEDVDGCMSGAWIRQRVRAGRKGQPDMVRAQSRGTTRERGCVPLANTALADRQRRRSLGGFDMSRKEDEGEGMAGCRHGVGRQRGWRSARSLEGSGEGHSEDGC